jgi:hypothetical protein
MQVNLLAVIVATVVQFIIGAIWYSLLFGKLWGRIHGFDKLPKATQEKMMKEMGPYYGLQALITLITSYMLATFLAYLPQDWSPYGMAAMLWLGFIVPAQVSAVIFGGTEKKWIGKKIAVQAGAALACIEAGAFVLHLFI